MTPPEGKLMEDMAMAPSVALPFRVGNLLCDESMEITCLKLLTDTMTFLPDPMAMTAASSANLSSALEEVEVVVVAMEGGNGVRDGGEIEVRVIPESDNEDTISIRPELSAGSLCSVVSDCSSISSAVEEFLNSDMAYEFSAVDSSGSISVKIVAAPTFVGLDVHPLTDDVLDSGIMVPSVAGRTIKESQGGGGRSVFLTDYVPLWGYNSICGRRPEMEDAVVAVPWFSGIPLRMLTNECIDGVEPSSFQVPAHFFGVYDGHGGAQVANYCRDRVHLALIEELTNITEGFGGTKVVDLDKQWERAFIDCFQKVDNEIGGKASRVNAESTGETSEVIKEAPVEPVAPETVGSTAVVAVICSSHIIIANCGDSRAVLCRGKQPVPLSVDHKPNREDEYSRIEAEGGKVIQWNGYRVFGVLAMSRAIGDKYLKPWIIPVPEVTIVSRAKEDECLILASDGLWDVMSNEEVCDAARKRILLWHKKNGITSSSTQRGEFTDPAAQAAAEYLSKLAIQKGSKDNITVIVVDLKAQRKFKTKS
ncbi:probable protein phosphatase 2C 6 isoform X1 [Typha angustifolia]|uniref:probable protein phosphatase 2C 6 isoform X1 n=1 Tax=Typha angustifolia TaxID=59011 RepID=UPI003C2B30F8